MLVWLGMWPLVGLAMHPPHKWRLQKQRGDRSDRVVEVERAHFRPWTLEWTPEGLRAADAQGV